MYVEDIEQCSCCNACVNACPASAISIMLNGDLKYKPQIDQNKCLNCGICLRACYNNSKIEFKLPQKSYGAWGKSNYIQDNCSSGGLATIFANKILHDGGYVAGCISDGIEIKHVLTNDPIVVDKMKGSKYVHSDIGYIYREIKEKLTKNILVLFVGTPCQVAGLKLFLKKEYEKLYTVDLICHGTPPTKLLQDYIEHKNKKNEKITEVSFRGYNDFKLTIKNNNKIISTTDSSSDFYFKAFLDNLMFAENCYNCQFAQNKRVSDITIGDYWGLDKARYNVDYSGRISAVILNTEHGEDLFNSIKDIDIECFESNYHDICKWNDNLNRPSLRPIDRDRFIKNLKKKGIYMALKKSSIYKKVIYYKIRKFVLYIPKKILLNRH